eukprot:7382371-Prymnesium_polylepis.1
MSGAHVTQTTVKAVAGSESNIRLTTSDERGRRHARTNRTQRPRGSNLSPHGLNPSPHGSNQRPHGLGTSRGAPPRPLEHGLATTRGAPPRPLESAWVAVAP